MTNDEIRSFLDRFRARVGTLRTSMRSSACYADDCVVVSPIFSTVNGRSPR